MAAPYQVLEGATLLAIESTIRQGAQAGIIADADLATGLSTILANIDTRVAASATAGSPVNAALVLAVKDAVRKGFLIQGSTLWQAGSLAGIYTDAQTVNGVPAGGKAAVGFGVTI